MVQQWRGGLASSTAARDASQMSGEHLVGPEAYVAARAVALVNVLEFKAKTVKDLRDSGYCTAVIIAHVSRRQTRPNLSAHADATKF